MKKKKSLQVKGGKKWSEELVFFRQTFTDQDYLRSSYWSRVQEYTNRLKSAHYAGKKPIINPDNESSRAIPASGTCRSMPWPLPWELSQPETGRFHPPNRQSPPNHHSDRKPFHGKIVWAILSSRGERPFSHTTELNRSSEENLGKRILFWIPGGPLKTPRVCARDNGTNPFNA